MRDMHAWRIKLCACFAVGIASRSIGLAAADKQLAKCWMHRCFLFYYSQWIPVYATRVLFFFLFAPHMYLVHMWTKNHGLTRERQSWMQHICCFIYPSANCTLHSAYTLITTHTYSQIDDIRRRRCAYKMQIYTHCFLAHWNILRGDAREIASASRWLLHVRRRPHTAPLTVENCVWNSLVHTQIDGICYRDNTQYTRTKHLHFCNLHIRWWWWWWWWRKLNMCLVVKDMQKYKAFQRQAQSHRSTVRFVYAYVHFSLTLGSFFFAAAAYYYYYYSFHWRHVGFFLFVFSKSSHLHIYASYECLWVRFCRNNNSAIRSFSWRP